MNLGEKIKKLRSNKGLTQDELAEILFVSRTAISKWESCRGFPNIESLKAISKFFSITLDDLLSSEELITLAQQEQKQKDLQTKNIIFGLLDCCMALMCFLPFFAQNTNDVIQSVSLFALTNIQPYLKILYVTIISGSVIAGLLTLIFRNHTRPFWRYTPAINIVCTAVFIISRQPYAAIYTFMFLVIKALVLIKHK